MHRPRKSKNRTRFVVNVLNKCSLSNWKYASIVGADRMLFFFLKHNLCQTLIVIIWSSFGFHIPYKHCWWIYDIHAIDLDVHLKCSVFKSIIIPCHSSLVSIHNFITMKFERYEIWIGWVNYYIYRSLLLGEGWVFEWIQNLPCFEESWNSNACILQATFRVHVFYLHFIDLF